MGIWDQLNSRTLFGSTKATAAQVNSQEKDIHIEEKNRALLNDVNLINESLMRDGGVMPGTMVLDVVTESDNGTYDVFIPTDGECWMICTLNWETKNADSISFYINDGTNQARIAYFGATAPDLGAEMPPNLYVTSPCKLEVQLSGSTGSNTATCTRVRVR